MSKIAALLFFFVFFSPVFLFSEEAAVAPSKEVSEIPPQLLEILPLQFMSPETPGVLEEQLLQETVFSKNPFDIPIQYPIEWSPFVGMTIGRYEKSIEKKDSQSGAVLITGDAEVHLGELLIMDNNQNQFRLVMDQKKMPQKMQLQGLFPVAGKLAGKIAGEITANEKKFSGEVLLECGRLQLRDFLNREWAHFSFDYFFQEETFLRLGGDLPRIKLSGFSFQPENIRLDTKGFLFDVSVQDVAGALFLVVKDFRLGLGQPAPRAYSCDIRFFGRQIKGAFCEFQDRFVKLTFESDFLWGRKNHYIIEFFADGKMRVLNSFWTQDGREVLFTEPLLFKDGSFSGKAEIQQAASDGSVISYLTCPEIRLDWNGNISGQAFLTKGKLTYFDPQENLFRFFVSAASGKFEFFEILKEVKTEEASSETVPNSTEKKGSENEVSTEPVTNEVKD